MKLNFKSIDIKKIIISMLLTMMAATIIIPAIAVGKPKIILFYTTWSAKSRAARPVVEQVATSYGGKVDLIELDMDNANITDQVRALGINIPASVPYIVIVDQNGKILSGAPISGQSYIQLKSSIDQYLGK